MKEKSKKIGLILLFGCFILSFVCLVASCTIKTKNGVKNSASAETCAIASCSQQLNAYISHNDTTYGEWVESTNMAYNSYFSSNDIDNWNNSAYYYNLGLIDFANYSSINKYIGYSVDTRNISSSNLYRIYFVPNTLTTFNQTMLDTYPYINLNNSTTQTHIEGSSPINLSSSLNPHSLKMYLVRVNAAGTTLYTISTGCIYYNMNIFTYDGRTSEFNALKVYSPFGYFYNNNYVLERENIKYYEGYDAGLQLSENDLPSTIWAIFDAPFGVLYQVLNFDILGVNLWLVVTGLFTLVLVIWVVKKFKN